MFLKLGGSTLHETGSVRDEQKALAGLQSMISRGLEIEFEFLHSLGTKPTLYWNPWVSTLHHRVTDANHLEITKRT